LTPRLLSPNRDPQFPFYTLLISGGHTLLVHSLSITQHVILLNTRDTAIGDYLDKVARVLKVPWDNAMPGAALEHWSQINDVDDNILKNDLDRWNLPRPLSLYKKNVLAFSFTGIRTGVESCVGKHPDMTEEEKKSLARAAQVLVFEHVSDKCILGIKAGGGNPSKGNLVVSGGVASNMAFRKMYLYIKMINNGSLRRTLDHSRLNGYTIVFPPVEFCTVVLNCEFSDDRIMLR
jgi:N6-L-threonylcarbamoyladenine synthase